MYQFCVSWLRPKTLTSIVICFQTLNRNLQEGEKYWNPMKITGICLVIISLWLLSKKWSIYVRVSPWLFSWRLFDFQTCLLLALTRPVLILASFPSHYCPGARSPLFACLNHSNLLTPHEVLPRPNVDYGSSLKPFRVMHLVIEWLQSQPRAEKAGIGELVSCHLSADWKGQILLKS